jgi:hypothetical protein
MATPQISVSASRGKGTVARVARIVYVLLSYALACGMLPYAVSKILAVQFQVFASSYAQPLSAVYGFFAIAAFFGRFRWLQMLLGFVEFVPSVLLLFRRTRAIGAVLLLGPILFVTVIDYAYLSRSYEDVRLIITTMLIADLILLMLDGPTRRWLFGLFTLGKGVTHRYWGLEFVVAVLLASAVIVPFWRAVHHLETDYGDLIGRPQINGRGTWNITSLLIDGTPADLKAGKEPPKAYFDFDGTCHITGLRATPIDCRFEPNGSLHTINLTRFPLGTSSVPVQGSYQVAGSTLTISGSAESHAFSMLLSRSGW